MIPHRFCQSLFPCSKLVSNCRRDAVTKQAVAERELTEEENKPFKQCLPIILSALLSRVEERGAEGFQFLKREED